MRKLINKRALLRYVRLQIVLATVTIIVCLMIWPFRYFYHSAYSGYEEAGETEPAYTEAVTMEEIVLQEFVPKEDHIRDLTVACRVDDVHYMDRVFVTLYDAEYQILYQEVLRFTEIALRDEIRITPDLDVMSGEPYYLGLNVHFDSVGTLRVAYADQNFLQTEECGLLSYAGVPYENQAAMLRFHYTAQYPAGLLALCIAGVAVCGILLYVGLVCLMEFLKKKNLVPQFLKGCLTGLGAAGVIFVGFCFYQLCVARYFGGEIWDRIVYTAACLILLCLLGYAFYKGMERIGRMPKKRNAPVKKNRRLSGSKTSTLKLSYKASAKKNQRVWIDYLQTVCLVCLFYEGVAYVNAPIQWKQDMARNMVFMLFGLFVLLTMKLRQVVNVFTVAWSLVLIPAGMVYCYLNGEDAHALGSARIMVVAADFWVIILIHTLRNIKRLREQRLNIPLGVCFALMCVFMLFNSFGKAWPFLMAVTFTLFYLQSYTEEDKDRIVHNMMNALLAHFGLMVIMCWLHRPYHYYRFSRYPMWFHTVASTGIYLSAVAAAALLRLFLAVRNSGHIFKKAWKEWIGNGAVLAYIAFALPRTAIVAIFGMGIVLAIGAAIVYRPGIRRYVQIAGILLLTMVLSVPVVYTATRCIPAVVDKPVYLNDAEDFDGAIREGEAPDSDNYMYFRALVRLWANRLWVPQDFIDRYLEDRVSADRQLFVLAQVASGELNGLPEADVLENVPSGEGDSVLNEMSNGRIAIFQDYLKRLKWSGHPQMGYDGDYEMLSGHAHNSFIQNAFDFGIPAGVLFLLLVLCMIFSAVYRIWTGKDRSEKQFMQFLTGCAFLFVSLTEYASNPCMPLCFITLFMLVTMRTEKVVVK